MTKLELMNHSQGLSDLFTGLETDLIANIVEYVKHGDLNASTPQWKMKLMAQLSTLDKANIKTIAQYAGLAPDMLSKALEIAALTAVEELEPGFKKLAEENIIKGCDIPIEETMARSLVTYNKQAVNSLNMVNTVMRYKAKTAAQKLINQTAELADKQSFLNMLSKATGKVVTGAESRQAAMRQCIKEMTDKGIPAFVDVAGREWSPEAYINMDIRTTANNVAHQAQFDRMDDYGLDLHEVSSHFGARPKCAKDQGKIFSRKNKSGYTTDLHGRKIRYYPWNSSSYGEPDGILGINCGHHIYPFTPGISVQRYFPYNEEENSKAYSLSQRQRELERRVRKSKRECASLDTLGDTEGFYKASQTLKQRQQALKKFCADNNLPVRTDRTAVVGYNRTVAGKVRKSVDKSEKSDIIKTEIEKGNIKLEINHEKQARHIKGEPEFKEGKSYLTISEKEAQEIINAKSGTGIPVFDRNGKWKNKELVDCGIEIGVDVDGKTKKETPTDKATIHYSKTGTHLVPRKEEKHD
ncbi:MAG: hypothetical protein E7508_10905 [Ruminococcus sp.]|nr:hypothetical protein [Ruminococcus sp.]